jgi:hypothetical protein
METSVLNPTYLEFIKALAGTVNIERLSEQTRLLADANLQRMMRALEKELTVIHSPLIT